MILGNSGGCRTLAAAVAALLASPVLASGWRSIGPAPQAHGYDFLQGTENVSGRVSALAWAPNIDGLGTGALFVGAAGGGVWRSLDYTSAAPHWAPLTDNLGLPPATEAGAIDVGCITVDTGRLPNVIYVGTGEANFSGDSRYGAGILKSTDGGASWKLLGASTFGRLGVSRIIVDPTDATGNTLYASMVFCAGGTGGNYGVYKSVDGGATWQQHNGTMGAYAMVTDMEYTLGPNGAFTLYAAVGWPGGNPSNGIYKSTDQAATWNPVGPDAASGPTVGRIALAASHVAQANPTVYAVAADPDGTAAGVYATSDGGFTWRASYPGNFVGYQGWYDLAIGVLDDGTIYLGGVSYPFNLGQGVLESIDGGVSWIAADAGANGITPHTDAHVFTAVGGTLYAGNDGGVWRYTPAAPHVQPFAAPRQSKVGPNVSSVALGRLDADAVPDVVAAAYYDDSVNVMLAKGDGTFGPPARYTVGTNPNQVVLGDFNKDTLLDIATANSGTNTVSVLLGTGDGVFSGAATFTAGSGPGGLDVGDLNHDGNPDIATCNSNGTVSALLGNGTGGFAPAINTPVPPGPYYGIAIADLNGDANPDIVTANFNTDDAIVLAGNGTGQFTTAATLTAGNGPDAVATGDLNGDGKPDVVISDYHSSSVSVFMNTSITGGPISFAPPISLPLGGSPNGVAVANLNGDAFRDIVTVNDNNTFSVLFETAPGTFDAAATFATGPGPTSLAIGDENGDTRPDVVVGAWQGCVSVNLNADTMVGEPGAWEDLNTAGLATLQLQGLAMHPADPDIYVEGSQDNGTARRDRTTGDVWDTVYGGDGGMVRFDPLNGSFAYKVAPQGSLGTDFFQISTDAGQTWSGRTSTIINDASFPGRFDDDRALGIPAPGEQPKTFPFYPVFAVDPLDGQRVVIGSSIVYETKDRATTWTAISTALTSSPAVTALAYAPGNDSVIYAGFENGQVRRTVSDGASWSDAGGGTPWGGRRITSLAVDPKNADIAYLSVYTVIGGRVWKTVNGGGAWTDISAALPAIPVSSLAIDPRTGYLYAGADLGVWATPDSGSRWFRYGSGLPNAQVLDLGLNANTNILGAATHGRSAWTISIRPGDVDGNGLVNAADAALALQIAGGLRVAAPDEYLRGKVAPGGGGITLRDAEAIVRMIYGL